MITGMSSVSLLRLIARVSSRAALVGEHPVHQQQVRTVVGDAGARRRAVLGFAHVEAGPAQPERDHVPDRLLVLDDQYLLASHDAPEDGSPVAAELQRLIIAFT
jgi:hypothetical protein